MNELFQLRPVLLIKAGNVVSVDVGEVGFNRGNCSCASTIKKHEIKFCTQKAALSHLPAAKTLITDKGYDSDEFRDALAAKGITPCIPSRSNRIADIIYDNGLYKTRGRIEIMFGRLKDWRRIAMRYDRAAHTFVSAIYVAATVIFWL